MADRRSVLEPGEQLTGPANDAATSTVVPEPAPMARELATETPQAPAASSSDGCQRSGNEAPLEIIRLEDGTVLVERRGNFMGPPPPTPVNQPVAPATTEAPVCEPMDYGGYDLQDVECLDMVPASSSSAMAPPPDHTAAAASDFPSESSSEEEEVYMESEASQLRTLANADCRMIAAAEGYADRLRAARVARTASTQAGSGGRELPAPEQGLSAAELRERALALRRRLGKNPRSLHPELSPSSKRLHLMQERMVLPELEGHASLSAVTASMLRVADMSPSTNRPSCPLYEVITQVKHFEIEGFTSLTAARHSRPRLSQAVADLSNTLHGLLRITPLRRVPPDAVPASGVPECLRDKIPTHTPDVGIPLVEQARAPSPMSRGNNAPGAKHRGTFLRYPAHTSVAAGAPGKTSRGAHACLCTCRQSARVPSPTCNILPQLPLEQLAYARCELQKAYARCELQKPCVTRVGCPCAAMPVPGTPIGGERASGSTIAEPQMSASVEDTDEDFRDPEATLLDPILLPKRRWGHYAKWALRHTDRLVPLIDRPTRAATTIPGPTKAKGVVDARTGPRGRAVAKMAARPDFAA